MHAKLPKMALCLAQSMLSPVCILPTPMFSFTYIVFTIRNNSVPLYMVTSVCYLSSVPLYTVTSVICHVYHCNTATSELSVICTTALYAYSDLRCLLSVPLYSAYRDIIIIIIIIIMYFIAITKGSAQKHGLTHAPLPQIT